MCSVPFVFFSVFGRGFDWRVVLQSSLIGKIEKARRYADQREERIRFEALSVRFRGENDEHVVTLNGSRWTCTCDFFDGYGVCCHTMALERVLDGMLPREARESAQLEARAV
jgi:hypothetical protein